MSNHQTGPAKAHTHGPASGHTAIDHAGHADYPHDGKLEHVAGKKVIRPLHDRIVIECVKEAERSKGGIIIPDTAKEKPMEGHVIAVGNGKVLEDGTVRKVGVNVGDRVLFAKYGGTEVKVDGADRLVVREDDILAVLES